MKKIFIFAATAALLASCAQDEVLNSYEPTADKAIGFETWTNLATRSAENSSATDSKGLENYHQTFKVWGYKNIASSASEFVSTPVFDGTEVTYDASAEAPFDTYHWTYDPVKYWDHAATSYDFHAAAPSTEAWTWTQVNPTDGLGNGYFEVSAEVKGESLPLAKDVTDQTSDVFGKGSTEDVDLMIATDVTKTLSGYTSEPVHFDFNHILSRLNIGVKISDGFGVLYDQKDVKVTYREESNVQLYKSGDAYYVKSGENAQKVTYTEDSKTAVDDGEATNVWNDETYKKVTEDDKANPIHGVVKLTGVKVHGLNSKGSFNENLTEANINATQLAAGTTKRWTSNTLKDYGFPNTEVTGAEDDGTETSDATINLSKEFTTGTGDAAVTFGTTDYKYVYQGLVIPQQAQYEQINLDGTSTENHPYIEITYTIDDQSYARYYNLAEVFGITDASATLDFCEGWQNNLKITIGTSAIIFDADVYKWADRTPDGTIDVQ